jgi:prepilin-type N-terminal cleavage/methylation domain-containing protein
MNRLSKLFGRKATGFTLVEIMIVVLIIGILLAIAIPNFVSARASSRAKACVSNLTKIDGATQQYLMDNQTSTYPSISQLIPTYLTATPVCPAGGSYSGEQAPGSGSVSPTLPTCSYGSTDGSLYAHVEP